MKSIYPHKITHIFIYIRITCTHICVSIYYAINGGNFFKSSLLTCWGYKHQAHTEVGIEESSLSLINRNRQALRQEDKPLEGRDSCLTVAWCRAVRNDCGENTVGGTRRQELGTLGPSVFRQPCKPTVIAPPRPLVPAVTERGPRGEALTHCSVAQWPSGSILGLNGAGSALTRWKGKCQARMPLKNRGGPPGDPPSNPRAPWLAVSGAGSQGQRNGCWGHGAGSEQALKRPMKWPVFLGSHASDVTAAKGITTLAKQEEGGGRHVH